MEQILPNLLILGPMETPPEGTENSLKLFLAGSIDLSPNESFKWQDHFIKAMMEIVSKEPGKGIAPFNTFNWILVNPYYIPKNPVPNIMNEEYNMYKSWELDAYGWVDGIFLNFLKRSTSPMPLLTLGYTCQSGKLVVRCPEQYYQYDLVRLITTKFGVVLMPSKVSNVLAVIQNFFSFVSGFQNITKFQLPE